MSKHFAPFGASKKRLGVQLPPRVSAGDAIADLVYFTRAWGWSTSAPQMSDVLFHGRADFNGWDLLDAFQTLRLPIKTRPTTYSEIINAEFPCLIIRADDSYIIVDGEDPDLGLRVRTGDKTKPVWIGIPRDTLVHVALAHSDDAELKPPVRDLKSVLRLLLPQIWPLFLASLVINFLGLATPFFVMATYNAAIPSRSTDVLIALAAGLLLAYASELATRRIRSAAMVHLAAELENRLGLTLLNKLMAFPLSALTRSDAYQQRARLRQFEGIRDAMLGPLVQSSLDFPFLLVFGGIIFAIAPSVGWIAVSMGLFYLAGFALMSPILRHRETQASSAQTEYRKLVSEVVENQLTIRRLGTAALWEDRVLESHDKMLLATFAAQRLARITGFALQSIIVIAGISGGFQAARLTIEGDLTLGGLIAILVLVWRLLSPIQALSIALEQGISIISNLKMIGAVLALPEETYRDATPVITPPVQPPIQFEQVSMRFPDSVSPALAGVSVKIWEGEILMVSGKSMSGKTVLAEMLAGLHQQVGGRILVDGADIRQIPSNELRASVAFALQEPEVFYGTIAQNLQFARPLANLDQMWAALEEAGIKDYVTGLDDRLDTHLSRDAFLSLPDAIKQGLSLAMTFIRPGPIFIFDQPTTVLPEDHAASVREAIARRREDGAVIVISNDPADMQLGDRFVVLDRGRVTLNDKGQRGREKAHVLLWGTGQG
ncbi:peptidase domain-containing ABC transporter [Litoreibacter roseus]|uniref:ATP-binding cassette domain-containing protein n=1 Tax=Litoreibacter roseus TaxID=2601869 RepID=A0A6N6JEZ4_9RHOB|nr:ABC transporter transmembrane domain-containing protein [Litoreibacter roseus]GFE63782.1 hypothetical protein KIN_08560 [Litoreibacter roseus]